MAWLKKLFSKPEDESQPQAKAKPTTDRESLSSLTEKLLPRWKKILALQDADQALSAYQTLLQEHPAVFSARNNMAVIYNERGQHDDALQVLTAVPTDDLYLITSDNLVTLGVTYFAKQDHPKAIEVLRQASGLSAAANLCFVLSLVEDFEAAIEAGKQAVEKYPDDSFAYANLARAYYKGGKEAEGQQLLEQAAKVIDIQTIKPGIRQNRSIHIALYDSDAKTLVMADANTGEILVMNELSR